MAKIRSARFRLCFGFLLMLSFLTTSCSSLQVPLEPPGFQSDELMRTSKAGIDLAAKPIEGTYQNWQLFNENLPERGIGVVWVILKNKQKETIDTTKAEWSLDIGPKKYGPVTASQVLMRYYRQSQVRFYSLKAEEKATEDLQKLAFQLDSLGSHRESAGFLYFPIEPTRTANWSHKGMLRLKGITLSSGQQVAIELPLSHANP